MELCPPGGSQARWRVIAAVCLGGSSGPLDNLLRAHLPPSTPQPHQERGHAPTTGLSAPLSCFSIPFAPKPCSPCPALQTSLGTGRQRGSLILCWECMRWGAPGTAGAQVCAGGIVLMPLEPAHEVCTSTVVHSIAWNICWYGQGTCPDSDGFSVQRGI